MLQNGDTLSIEIPVAKPQHSKEPKPYYGNSNISTLIMTCSSVVMKHLPNCIAIENTEQNLLNLRLLLSEFYIEHFKKTLIS